MKIIKQRSTRSCFLGLARRNFEDAPLVYSCDSCPDLRPSKLCVPIVLPFREREPVVAQAEKAIIKAILCKSSCR